MATSFLDLQGNPISEEQVLGSGGSALVLIQDNVAVKIPLRCPWSNTYEVQANTQKLRHEQDSYLTKCQPSLQLQLLWCLEITRTLSFIHDRCVLVADIASQNFLLDSDLSIKLCDISEASILPLGSDMKTVDDHGFNAQIDIGLLGTVMYEIVTGEKLRVDLFKDNSPTDGRAHWPKREFLLKTTDLWLGCSI
ncbi:hypothetical protein BDV26DRAFT_281740 [Aspergillus bertholletiae]|uniref:Protein kinase domain-containing protein n=1 Tax=Aspergillus bertholletiae TaxID=1226010 RepID=A0A5N7B784_9EURO|nr:hypothetical protein BDV26DRAFT_281740 [Aspergillus bertholletiae]